jgi:transketolase
VRGKGLPSIERRADRWFVALTSKEVAGLIEELHGGAETALASQARIVR